MTADPGQVRRGVCHEQRLITTPVAIGSLQDSETSWLDGRCVEMKRPPVSSDSYTEGDIASFSALLIKRENAE